MLSSWHRLRNASKFMPVKAGGWSDDQTWTAFVRHRISTHPVRRSGPHGERVEAAVALIGINATAIRSLSDSSSSEQDGVVMNIGPIPVALALRPCTGVTGRCCKSVIHISIKAFSRAPSSRPTWL